MMKSRSGTERVPPVRTSLRVGLALVFTALALTSCYSTKRAIKKGEPYGQQIRWPEDYALSETPFYIHSQVDIEAPPETVWSILIEAERWPEWYGGMRDVEVEGSSDGVLAEDSRMIFNTMKRDFAGTITEFAPPERLAWETVNDDLHAYHAWLIVPTETGSRVVTAESQYGKLARLQKVFRPHKLERLHDVWLSELKNKAEAAHQTATQLSASGRG